MQPGIADVSPATFFGCHGTALDSPGLLAISARDTLRVVDVDTMWNCKLFGGDGSGMARKVCGSKGIVCSSFSMRGCKELLAQHVSFRCLASVGAMSRTFGGVVSQ